ncbi:MAG: GNAT family N-acetyltransferase, partial [Alphaproteobacteria bacterium]
MSDDGGFFTLRLLTSLASDVRAADWDALVGGESPFLEWGWLASLEESRCVGGRSGWSPQHLALFSADDRLVAACPMYLKTNSEGEFVFDWSWAEAAHRAGLDWYPKMLVGVPFTPATGLRFLVAPGIDRVSAVRTLARALRGLCEENGLSSVHVNFCTPDEAAVLREEGWLERRGYQFKWRNYGYDTFEDWLGALRHKRRKQVRRERRELDEQGIRIEALCGDGIPGELFEPMYRIYATTVDKHVWGRRYLTPAFFELLRDRFRRNLCFLVARRHGELLAGTFNVTKSGGLYCRYWGCFEEQRFLHFNVCYYATIEHCIRSGIGRFEPGAGGEFKWLRGFDAEPTTSMHWVRDPRLSGAIERFLASETAEVDRVIDEMHEHSQLKHAELGGDGGAG